MIRARRLGAAVLCATLLGGADAGRTQRHNRSRRLGGVPSDTCLTARACEDQKDRVGATSFHVNNDQ